MRTIQNIMGRILAFMAVCTASVAWISCSSDLDETPANVSYGEEHTAVMHLDAGRPSYAGKRAASAEWSDGDVVYLRFYQADGVTVICGKATYSAATSLWSISYYGNLATGNTYKCEAFYFTDATAVDNFNVTMTPTSCAYEDLAASYLVDGGELFVSASLSPKTARMRFMGTAGQKISVQKIVYNTAFNLTENSYATSSEQVDLQVGEDGYTPYMYGSLEESNEITVRDIYYEYTKTFDPAKFAPGESGYITMPSQVENKGWSQTYYYPENAIDLGLSVRWAKTNVGASISTNSGIFCAWGDPEGTYNLNFTVSEDASLTRVGQIDGGEQNGVRLVSVKVTPGETQMEYAVFGPLPGDAAPALRAFAVQGENLTKLQPAAGSERWDEVQSCTVHTDYFDAVPEGVTELRVQMLDKNAEEEVLLAEWTVTLP